MFDPYQEGLDPPLGLIPLAAGGIDPDKAIAGTEVGSPNVGNGKVRAVHQLPVAEGANDDLVRQGRAVGAGIEVEVLQTPVAWASKTRSGMKSASSRSKTSRSLGVMIGRLSALDLIWFPILRQPASCRAVRPGHPGAERALPARVSSSGTHQWPPGSSQSQFAFLH